MSDIALQHSQPEQAPVAPTPERGVRDRVASIVVELGARAVQATKDAVRATKDAFVGYMNAPSRSAEFAFRHAPGTARLARREDEALRAIARVDRLQKRSTI